jgi:hypothetical protein
VKQPAARVETVRDTTFGAQLADPYRWMEQNGPEFGEWIAGQAAYAENSTLRIIDVATGGLSAEAMPRTPHGAVSWLPEGSGFVYHRFGDPAPGTPPSQWRLTAFLSWRVMSPESLRSPVIAGGRGSAGIVFQAAAGWGVMFTPDPQRRAQAAR